MTLRGLTPPEQEIARLYGRIDELKQMADLLARTLTRLPGIRLKAIDKALDAYEACIGELPQGYERDRLAETVKPGDIPMDRLRPPVNPGPIIPAKQGMHLRRTNG